MAYRPLYGKGTYGRGVYGIGEIPPTTGPDTVSTWGNMLRESKIPSVSTDVTSDTARWLKGSN